MNGCTRVLEGNHMVFPWTHLVKLHLDKDCRKENQHQMVAGKRLLSFSEYKLLAFFTSLIIGSTFIKAKYDVHQGLTS